MSRPPSRTNGKPTMAPEDEARLVARLKLRDEAAFNQFVALYKRRVFTLVFRMLGNHAEADDLAQEVFITVFQHIAAFRGDSRLRTWVYQIAVNHSKNRIKALARRNARGHNPLDEANDREAADGGAFAARPARPDEAAEGTELERAVQRALVSLDEEHREVIVLRDVEGLSYDEIVQITGVAEGTVKSRLHRGRAALREAIESRTGLKLDA
jgi:RNA polymerase sigma-70 factor (ECF subfamily)